MASALRLMLSATRVVSLVIPADPLADEKGKGARKAAGPGGLVVDAALLSQEL
jgi:hypothetical protein